MHVFGSESDDLLDFIDVLRRYGHRITPEQCIAAQNLLLALAAYGALTDVSHHLSTYLAPIFCTSPEEQEKFEEYFQRWQRRLTTDKPKIKEIENEVESGTFLKRGYYKLKSFIREHSLGLILTACIIVIGLIVTSSVQIFRNYLTSLQPLTVLEGRVTDTSGIPSSNATVSYGVQKTYTDASGRFSVSYRQGDLPIELVVEYPGYNSVRFNVNSPVRDVTIRLEKGNSSTTAPIPTRPTKSSFKRFLLPSALIVVVMIALLIWSFSRRSILRKKLSKENSKVERLYVKGVGEHFARLFALRRTAQELRRPESINAIDLNVAATIEQTIVKGMFTPVNTARKASPEYLVLIDRSGFKDQQAGLGDEVVGRLIKSDVYIDRYYFQSDPRLCRSDGKKSYVSLQELAALYGNRRLIIFSDAAAFFDSVSGSLERWTSIFSNWKTRALLTPQNIATDYRRWALADQGFLAMPVGKESLAALADHLNEIPVTTRWSKESESFPDVLLDRPERWVDSHPPSNDILDEVCDQLRQFLGLEGYVWLGACAVYPMLYWDLTLYLGYKFCVQYEARNNQWVDRTFKLLMQLPWFRHGSIPDWLRTRLISDLRSDQKQHVRMALEELLMSSLRHPTGLALPIVIERSNRSAARKLLLELIKTRPPESPFRDQVFLSFMTRFRYSELVVRVPRKVQGILTSKRRSMVEQFINPLAKSLEPHEDSFSERSGYPIKKEGTSRDKKLPRKVNRYVHRILTALIFATMGVVAISLWRGQIPIEWLASFGYKGVFVLSLINGVAPVGGPSQIATFFVASKLNPFAVGLTAGIGGAIGELAGYSFGYFFRSSQSEELEQKFQRIANWKFFRISREHSFIPLFVLAAIPNPFFDPVSALAGSLRIRIGQYFFPVLLGKVCRHLVIALVGYYTLTRGIRLAPTKDSMAEFLSSGWFVVAVFGIGLLIWIVRSIAESEPDPLVLNLTFFAFAGQCILTAELARQGRVSAVVSGLALTGIIILLGQIFVFRGHVNKTTDHYKYLLNQYKKPSKYNDAEIERWADVLVRITGVDFWPQLYSGWSKGFGSGPRARRRSQALMMLKEGEFECGDGGITEEALTVPEDERKWPWRLHAFLCFLAWFVFVVCIQAAKVNQ